jgi:hypothetical protein
MAMKGKCLDLNMKLEVIHLYEVGSSLRATRKMIWITGYELTSSKLFAILRIKTIMKSKGF